MFLIFFEFFTSMNHQVFAQASNFVNVKAVLLGESKVGKTSLAKHFTTGSFDDNSTVTISASCYSKDLIADINVPVKFYVWDTAGQEQFRSISPIYYRSSHVAIIVFDVTALPSLEVCNFWVNELKENGPTDIPIIVAANKSDLEMFRQISVEDCQAFADSIGAKLFETSAVTGKGVNELFDTAFRMGYKFSKSQKNQPKTESALQQPKDDEKSCC